MAGWDHSSRATVSRGFPDLPAPEVSGVGRDAPGRKPAGRIPGGIISPPPLRTELHQPPADLPGSTRRGEDRAADVGFGAVSLGYRRDRRAALSLIRFAISSLYRALLRRRDAQHDVAAVADLDSIAFARSSRTAKKSTSRTPTQKNRGEPAPPPFRIDHARIRGAGT